MKKCEKFECGNSFHKTVRFNGKDLDCCRTHYIQLRYTDPALDKLKKYWIIPVIGIALIGLYNVWK